MLSTPIELRQICWSEETFEKIPTGFIPIDYRHNDRPDWRELWPIRDYLCSHSLHDEVMYGFLSPKFVYKTGLSYREVQDFITLTGVKRILHSSVFLGSFFVCADVSSRGDVSPGIDGDHTDLFERVRH